MQKNMKLSRCFAVITVVLFGICVRCFCAGTSVTQTKARQNLMPDILKELYVGMQEEEFKSARSGLMDDTYYAFPGVEDSYVEKLTQPKDLFLAEAKYGVKDGRLSFVWVVGPEDESLPNVIKLLPGFISGCIKKYGENYEKAAIEVAMQSGTYYEAAMIWKRENDVEVIVKFTTPVALKTIREDELSTFARYGLLVRLQNSTLGGLAIPWESLTREQDIVNRVFSGVPNLDEYKGEVFK